MDLPVRDVVGALAVAVGALAAGWVAVRARQRYGSRLVLVALIALGLNLVVLVAEIVLIVRGRGP